MKERQEYISQSVEETEQIAGDIAAGLTSHLVLLFGDLGAGKTVFAKGFVDYFVKGVKVLSPTFAIMNTYADMVYHFDLYRIESHFELDAIGAEEYFFGDKPCIVEWADRVPESCFPEDAVRVFIEKIDENTRKIIVENS